MEYEWIACFFCAPEDQMDYLENTLKEYDIGQYAIAYEETDSEGKPKPHYHFLFEGTKQIYTNFSKVIVDKFNLRRKNGKQGGQIKYGKVKKIRSLDAMLSYTLKHQWFRTNMSEAKIKEAIENSFVKTKRDQIAQTITDNFDDDLKRGRIFINGYDDPDSINISPYSVRNTVKKHIIKICIELKFPLSPVRLKSYFWHFLNKSLYFSDKPQIKQLIFEQLLL